MNVTYSVLVVFIVLSYSYILGARYWKLGWMNHGHCHSHSYGKSLTKSRTSTVAGSRLCGLLRAFAKDRLGLNPPKAGQHSQLCSATASVAQQEDPSMILEGGFF
jgi:hypothetical protein